ncbi:MAG: NAD(P)/FAD-dependent oxidoreductase [Oscillospiraceae bacterium]|nr:NAD(P)/FAD-dependent oxidoreductase [Oscillospiraceae bacterium]
MSEYSASPLIEPDIVVIGGGAAGMLASCIAANNGARVLLLEQNSDFGKKLLITGKGRCNLTNDCPVANVLENITTGGRFLRSAINGFTPRDVMSFFESIGVPLKTERGTRVFPVSDKSSEVVDALSRYMKKTGVLARRLRALRLIVENGRINGVATSKGAIRTTSVILATGGMSYPDTGSTGDGYKMAGDLGHTITPLQASLVPLEADLEICARIQGLSLRNVRLSVYDGGEKPIFEDFGELLFTHYGMSGPLIISASAHMRDFAARKYSVLIDLKPGLDEKKLDLRILRDFKKYSNRDFSNSLDDLLTKALIPVIIEKSGIARETKTHSISREQRLRLGKLIKSFPIDIDQPRPIEEAIITSGGVDLNEINPKTMESKLVRGLYFAGEVLNADAYTGGFNLQIAWSTAYAAAKAASSRD